MKTIKQMLQEATESKDVEYVDNYDRPSRSFAKLVNHIESKGYKIYKIPFDGIHRPKDADVTYHIAYGDDSPNGVTIHASGKAANDKELHSYGRRCPKN